MAIKPDACAPEKPLVTSHMTEGGKLHRGTAGEVFRAFLKLGLTSFGGPIAHLGYFRAELVQKRGWVGEAEYAELVSLCQFLPGPASSQVGFALGMLRGGPLGALAAWCAFTLPSALLLFAFALGASAFGGPVGAGLIHGLKIVAVAVVAQAVWGMARTLTPDAVRAAIAVVAVVLVFSLAGTAGQMSALVIGGLAGLVLCRTSSVSMTPGQGLHFPISRPVGAAALALYFGLLFLLPVLSAAFAVKGIALFDAFYRAGALVFGGGHVVLPLLETGFVQTGWVSPDAFLAGYGATQAVPGPLFTFAAYLGAVAQPGPYAFAASALGLVAIFLPGLLLVVGVLPFWGALRARPAAQAAIRGANAAVVGILAAALYDPVWIGAILTPWDFLLALAGFLLLTVWGVAPWIVVALTAVGGVVLSLV
jgi:chromate transporter